MLNAVLKKARVGKEPELRQVEAQIEAAETARVRQQGAVALREAKDLITGLSLWCLSVCLSLSLSLSLPPSLSLSTACNSVDARGVLGGEKASFEEMMMMIIMIFSK